MAEISRGYSFGATEQVTAAKLHTLVDSATVTEIVNADITDNTITDDKIVSVGGAKLVTLANIPSGAGLIPTANIPNPFPSGGIIMWSGSVASIPSGWLLCNGSIGTPDLRDKFVIGAGSTYAVNDTGGSTTIAEANLPSHTHAAGTLAAANESAHTHYPRSGAGNNISSPVNCFPGGAASNFYSETDGSNMGATGAGSAHGHTISGSTDAIGSGTAYKQPYYALCYIMKS